MVDRMEIFWTPGSLQAGKSFVSWFRIKIHSVGTRIAAWKKFPQVVTESLLGLVVVARTARRAGHNERPWFTNPGHWGRARHSRFPVGQLAGIPSTVIMR